MVLGFFVSDSTYDVIFPKAAPKENGYATNEFEITAERLGVYVPVCQYLS